MSAYVVSRKHIDALVNASLTVRCRPFSYYHDGERHTVDHTNVDTVGAMLWAENVRSVEDRYEHLVEAGESLPGTYQLEMISPEVEPIEVPEWVAEYRFNHYSARQLPPVAILKAINCYEYQSCEHDGWESSAAHAFCESLRDEMIGMLPGYDDAAWGID